MAATINPKTWFQSADAVGALLPAGALFSLLKRSFAVPSGFAALVQRTDGAVRLHAAGAEIRDDDVREVLFVRSQPVELALTAAEVAAADRYLCDAVVDLRVRVLAERHELEAFRERVMGSAAALTRAGLGRYYQPVIEEALRLFAQERAASELVDGQAGNACAAAVEDAVRALCFAGGLVLDGAAQVRFTSAALARARETEQQTARRLQEHRAQEELRAAISAAQEERLAHLEEMLTRLQKLADDSPDVALPQLMRAFDESQRSQLYEALFHSRARQRATRWIVVVAGGEVLFFDPQAPADPARRVALEGDAGALRSVQVSVGAEGGRLLLGAAQGVYVLDADGTAPAETYLFTPGAGVRGGVNSVALSADDVVATHSAQGVLRWRRNGPVAPEMLFGALTAAAQAVRCAQFAAGRFWCSIDTRIVSVPAGDLDAAPESLICPGVVTALCATPHGVYAGTADGEVLCWDAAAPAGPRRIHAGGQRAAESVHLLETGGAARLFFTDTSLAVFARVVGDTFVCRYEAGGQTIRRAEVATDVIAAVNDPRDRVIVWWSDQPARPSHVIPVSRLTGRSVQDVCLVPMV